MLLNQLAEVVGNVYQAFMFCLLCRNVSSGRQQITLQVDASDVDYEIMREREEALQQLEVGFLN